MAAEINVPYGVYAHGWWTNEGQKISKSVGNVIDPIKEIEWIQSFGCENATAVDYFRYFLLREVPFGNDGDYSRTHLITRVNAELVNNIGNLVQRSLAMIYKNCDAKIPAGIEHSHTHIEPFIENYFQAFDDLAFDKAMQAVIDFANLVNKKFNDTAPWNLKKLGKIDEMNASLHETAESLRLIAILLAPFTPVSANKILDLLNVENNQRDFANLNNFLKVGHGINEPKAVFPRLEIL
jgi:methionyl-tRNA synthetase